MKKAQALFHAGKVDNLPAVLLDVYRSTGVVALRYPDTAWQEQLPKDAKAKDYQLVSFLAYRPESEQPLIVADIVVSMWQDDPFTIVKWYPSA